MRNIKFHKLTRRIVIICVLRWSESLFQILSSFDMFHIFGIAREFLIFFRAWSRKQTQKKCRIISLRSVVRQRDSIRFRCERACYVLYIENVCRIGKQVAINKCVFQRSSLKSKNNYFDRPSALDFFFSHAINDNGFSHRTSKSWFKCN